MSSSSINLINAVRFYIDKIVADDRISGMKVLLLDEVTTRIISMVYSQSQILEKDYYLVEKLNKNHELMNHMKAAVFIEPTELNIDVLVKELRNPKFSEYHIFFNNIVSKDQLTRLGRADEHDVVRQVQEYYADFMTINEDFFHLGADNSISLSSPLSRTLESSQLFERNVRGVLSLLLALKRRPSQIRYQSGSDLTRRLATDIITQIEKDDIFVFPRQEGPLLLLLDRRDDPITPLLTQWTYQAMVHELLGLNNNRVLLKGVPNIAKDLEEVVLSCTQDDFFAKHRNSNFGDLGTAVKSLLDEYQHTAKMNDNINSIEDMQKFMLRYPEFRSKSINVSKHVAIMSELARLTDVCQLLDISELEQEISCDNDHNAHKKLLLDRINNNKVQNADKLRLSILFIIKYESYNEIGFIKLKLSEKGINSQQLAILDAILEYASENKRTPGLFSSSSIISQLGKTFTSSLNGVTNVYTQHQPLLYYTLDSIIKGKLKESSFPLIFGNLQSRPSEIIVFIIGGVTFEEATKISEFNSQNLGYKVILGGSCIHNSTSFIKEIVANFSR